MYSRISARPGCAEMGLQIELSKAQSGPGPRLVLGLQLGCSVGHGTLSPALEPLTQSSEALKC